VQAGIGRGVADALAHANLAPLLFFTLLFALYLFLGSALDGLAMMLLTVPALYPTLRAMGYNDIWFGVFLVIQVELAQLSPPIGLNLLAVQSIARDVDMKTITYASLPYAAMLSALCFLLYFFPSIALWLPATMK
jgi:TRAP-type C4-dicarboxylate transport system permease large subunit